MLNESQATSSEPEDCWPHTRTYEALQKTLRRLSDTNKKILGAVAGLQIYAFKLSEAVSLGRGELIYRCKELEAQQLLHAENLTDKRYELHPTVTRVLGTSGAGVIVAMMA
jgi:hypothetical protein